MSGRAQNKPSAEPTKAPPEATTPAPDTVPMVPTAELDALRASHAAELEQLRAEHAKAVEAARAAQLAALRTQRESFDRAWQEREESHRDELARTAAALKLPEAAPVSGRVRTFRARFRLGLTGPDGRRIHVGPGETIPRGSDLTGLAADAYEEG